MFYIKNLVYLIIIIVDKIFHNKILKKKLKWEIYYTRTNWRNIGSKKFYKIETPKYRWFADPFVVKKKENNFIFFEDYNLKNKKGSISCVKVDKNNKKHFYYDIIQTNYHLSFPFIFQYKKKYYLIPETKSNNSVEIYKCNKFPHKWVFYKKIFDNIKAVDNIVFELGKSWYLFNNESDTGRVFSKLIGYKSKNPINGKWKKLKKKVILNSNLYGRNAGLINENKNIFRVSQSYLPGRYGAGIFVNKIHSITETGYKEKTVKNIFPGYLDKIKGIHSLNSLHKFTVLDYSKWKKKV